MNILEKLKEDNLHILGINEMQELYEKKYAAKSQLKYLESIHNQGATKDTLTMAQRAAIKDINTQLIEKLETGTTNANWYVNKLKTENAALREDVAKLTKVNDYLSDDIRDMELIFKQIHETHPEVMESLLKGNE